MTEHIQQCYWRKNTKEGGIRMAEILVLIARIILIIAGGMNAIDATMKVAKESGMEFDTLWRFLPNKWK